MTPDRGFVPDDVWLLRQVTDPRLAPDGRHVAFVVATPDRETDTSESAVWVTPTDGSVPARRFTAGPKDSAPRWSPDGRFLAFVADRGEGTQLLLAPLDGGEPEALTHAPFGVSGPAWSPDGTRLAYVARTGAWTEPDAKTAVERSAPTVVTGLRNRLDGEGRFDSRRSHVFVVDAGSGEAMQVTEGDFDDADPSWSPSGDAIVFTSDRSDERADREHRDVWVVAVEDGGTAGTPRRLTRGLGSAASPRFSPDGETIAYVGHENEAGNSAANAHLMVVPADGTAPPRAASAALDRTVFGMVRPAGSPLAWSADGESILFVANDGGRQPLYRVGRAPGSAVEQILGGDRQIVGLDAVAGTVAFVSVWPSVPPEVSVTTEDGSAVAARSAANETLRAAVRFAPLERLTHQAADGTTIESYLLYPDGYVPGSAVPTVLEIHGGPHGWHPQASMLPLYQSLAAAGYAVVLPNPRGSHGFGEAFARACVGDWGGADFADLMGAVDALVARGIADPNRLFVAGYSYGGYMTSWTVGHTDRFAAACVSAPVVDLVSMWGTTDIPFFSEFEAGGTPWERREEMIERSPLTYLPNVTTPVMVLHWEGDLRCPIGQGEELFQGLRRLGKEVVLVRYPGGYHIVRTPSQMADFVRRHLEFFAAHGGLALP